MYRINETELTRERVHPPLRVVHHFRMSSISSVTQLGWIKVTPGTLHYSSEQINNVSLRIDVVHRIRWCWLQINTKTCIWKRCHPQGFKIGFVIIENPKGIPVHTYIYNPVNNNVSHIWNGADKRTSSPPTKSRSSLQNVINIICYATRLDQGDAGHAHSLFEQILHIVHVQIFGGQVISLYN